MVLQPPNSVFRNILAGKLKLKPDDFLERVTRTGSIPPKFPPGRTEVLRKKLLKVGIVPESVGLPSPKPFDTSIFIPNAVQYKDACREIKYDYVKQQVAQMSKTVEEWRQGKKAEAAKAASKKLPF